MSSSESEAELAEEVAGEIPTPDTEDKADPPPDESTDAVDDVETTKDDAREPSEAEEQQQDDSEDSDDEAVTTKGKIEMSKKKKRKADDDDSDDSSESSAIDEEENDDDDDDDDDRKHRDRPSNTTVYDFDIMMAKKKEENSKRRRRRNYDIINDNDDIIADIINQMKDSVEGDIEANRNRMAATRKLRLLPFVVSQLRKIDLRDAFLDSDVLSVMTEWLAPLPDKSLPHLDIRENLLKILIDFNLYDVDKIKSSGIGKAVMYLYKHPKETRENKQRAKQLISSWSRPIFNLDSSFTAISREEREQRDLELMSKKRRVSGQESNDSDGPGPSPAAKKAKEREEVARNPGDKGWIPRARVPAPSMRDYVIRPQSKIDADISKNSKRPSNMLEKLMRAQQEKRRANKQQRAINMKIDRV